MFTLIYLLSLGLIVSFITLFIISLLSLFFTIKQKRSKGIICFATCIGSLIFALIFAGLACTSEPNLKEGYNRIKTIDDFTMPISSEYRNYQVSLFKPSYYEIGKPNFASGYCYGIVSTIRDSYYKQKPQKMSIVKDKSGQDPDDKYLYPHTSPYYYRNLKNEPGVYTNFTWDELIGEKSKDISIYKLRDKQIVRNITQAHGLQHYSATAYYNWPEKEWYWLPVALGSKFFYGTSVKREVNINYIADQIRKNELVLIGVGRTGTIGHALLCYRIELYGDNRAKLYVLDPNFIYAEPGNDFESKTYILIWRENGKQHYIYNPNINNNYPYQAQFNSYAPKAFLCWD